MVVLLVWPASFIIGRALFATLDSSKRSENVPTVEFGYLERKKERKKKGDDRDRLIAQPAA